MTKLKSRFEVEKSETSRRGRTGAAVWTVLAILTAAAIWASGVGGMRTASAGEGAASESAAERATRPIAIVSSAGYEPVWRAIGRVAKELKLAGAVEGARAIYGDVQGLDREKPFGLVVATNGSEIVPFAFLPIENVEKLEFVGDSDWKEKFERTPEGLFWGDAPRLRLLEKDGWLFVFEAGKEALVPTTDPTAWLGADRGNGALNVDVDLTALPEELLEAGFAALRLFVAENAPISGDDAETEVALERFDATFEYYSAIFDSLERVAWTLDVDATTGDLVWDATLVCKDGTPLAEKLAGAEKAETRWGAIAETPNAVFATVDAGKRSALEQKFLQAAQESGVENIKKTVEIGLDDEEERALAEKLVDALAKITASTSGETFDFATAFACDPFVFSWAASPCDGERVDEFVRQILEKWKRDEPELGEKIDKFVKLGAETIEGFSVSKIDAPCVELSAEIAEIGGYWNDKTLAVRCGTTADAILFVAALDSDEADAEFARIAAASKTKTPAPKRAEFAVAPLGAWALEAIDGGELDGATDGVRKTLKRIAEADDARLTVELKIDGNRLNARYVVKSGIFRLIGDLARLGISGNAGFADEGEDLDAMFEEE